MTPDAFRKIALNQFDAIEGSHMGHADFRVGGKVFASLPPVRRSDPDVALGMVRLPPAEQQRLIRARPEVYEPAAGAWGRSGCTYVRLKAVRTPEVRQAMRAAWMFIAPPAMRTALGIGADEDAPASTARKKKTTKKRSRRKA